MTKAKEYLNGIKFRDKIKVPEMMVDDSEIFGEEIDNLDFEYLYTDEFDIPPNHVFRVTINFEDIL